MSKRHASKAGYGRLFFDPSLLFGPGTKITLWPNGQPEIWIQSTQGNYGIRITRASNGPAGFGVALSTFAGCPDIDLFPYVRPDDVSVTKGEDDRTPQVNVAGVRHFELCQYRPDARSQAVRAWYRGEGEYPGEGEVQS